MLLIVMFDLVLILKAVQILVDCLWFAQYIKVMSSSAGKGQLVHIVSL